MGLDKGYDDIAAQLLMGASMRKAVIPAGVTALQLEHYNAFTFCNMLKSIFP